MIGNSLRIRLSIWIAGLILGVALIAGIFAWWSATQFAYERQDENLGHLAVLLAEGRLAIVPGEIVNIRPDDDLDHEFRLSVHELGYADGHGDHVSGLVELGLDPPNGLQTVTLGGTEWRVYISRENSKGQRFAVGQSTIERTEEIHVGGLRTVVPLLVLVPILLLVITDLISRLLAPIRHLADSLDVRPAHDLSSVATHNLPSEIRPYTSALNGLLARARDAATMQRRFVADAAHELRTPLTALSLQAERILASSDLSDQARRRTSTLLGGIERAQALVRQLLSLARAQEGVVDDQAQEKVPLERVIKRVIENQLPLAFDRNIDIGMTRVESVDVCIPENSLVVLLGNLVGNAVRYTPTGGRVDIEAYRDGDNVVLSVIDTGPGIPIELHERVFDAFYRQTDNTDTEGSGLGLSIVRAIAERHGASVTLAKGENGQGLCITVTAPIAAINGNLCGRTMLLTTL